MKLLVAASLASLVVAQKGEGKGPKTGGGPPKTGGGGGGGASLNEFTNGGCKGTIMIYARGSAEPGNVGMIIGPPLFTPLKKLVPDIAIEGVPYAAGLLTNLGKGGADPKGVEAATKLFQDAHTKCPQSAIIGGGYSQGAAVMHRSVEKLSKDVQNHIAGIVLYGDTQNKQDNGQIKNFPKEKVKIYCGANDGVCGGGLNVNGGHFAYTQDMQPGAEYLAERIKIWKAGNGGASEGAASAPAPKAPKSSPKAAPPKPAEQPCPPKPAEQPSPKPAADSGEMSGHGHGR